ncbi:homeobox protein 5-like [Glossina fuscipes]|uniref:Homeobox protein 5-like n=1 Tax=Glossina fuscipes TaxID=7396 RepID=A0A9C6E460_9MUSC|nr:homeobox protein 5-like [Glossina fuscipes]
MSSTLTTLNEFSNTNNSSSSVSNNNINNTAGGASTSASNDNSARLANVAMEETSDGGGVVGATTTTTTIIKQSPTSPVPLDATNLVKQSQQQQHQHRTQLQTNESLYGNHSTVANNISNNIDVTMNPQQQQQQQQQQHQTVNLKLNTHSSGHILNTARPPPPSYHTATTAGKIYHPNTNTCHISQEVNTLTAGTVNEGLPAPRLSAYEQFLKLSAQEYTVAADNAALNLSSAAAAAAAMAAAAAVNVTGEASNSAMVGGSNVISHSNIIGGNTVLINNGDRDLSSNIAGNVCERN